LKVIRPSHFSRKRRSKKLDQSKLADIANTTLVNHQFASRSPLQQQVGFVGLVA
jgi:hypothetical protein